MPFFLDRSSASTSLSARDESEMPLVLRALSLESADAG